MNLGDFFEHWSITENPFRGEEARTDEVFARIGLTDRAAQASPESPLGRTATHSDFEKILGDLTRPSTSIVFGEKGSGKTAIRLQIADRVRRHNDANPEAKVFLIPYDDLNATLGQLHDRLAGSTKDPATSLKKMRLVDHMDSMLSIGVGRVVNALLGGENPPAANLGDNCVRVARRMPVPVRRDLLLLQALYDANDAGGDRTTRMRRLLRVQIRRRGALGTVTVVAGWFPPLALFVWARFYSSLEGMLLSGAYSLAGALALVFFAALAKRFLWDRLATGRLTSRLSRQLRTVPRSTEALAANLARLDASMLDSTVLPLTGSDEQRYAMLGRLRRVLGHFGFTGTLVVIDRVDEPTLISGDPDRMRSVIWPLFNNKFLQQEGFGLKLLLPIELRHALFKESNAFFQEARLDKQNLIERLSWSGATLYDLCTARLSACRKPGAEPISLLDLFAEDVTRQDVVDSLGHMQQPRDAFKFMYRCLTEHCSNVSVEQEDWRIPRLVLEQVRKAETERVQQLHRGIRPA